MDKINFPTALVTSAMVITGVITALWVAFQIVDSSYKNKVSGLEYQISLMKVETAKTFELMKKIKDDSEKHNADIMEASTLNNNRIIEICTLLQVSSEASQDLKNICKEILLVK